MKDEKKLTHKEIIDGLTQCFRELIETEVSNRNMPNIINRGKAIAQIVTAVHREEIMESKRDSAKNLISLETNKTVKKLKPLDN
jgi:hypothetical protein